ncbi:MAG: hypothetical protein RR275_00140 [Lachnospiraceae bacterium]
MTKNKYPITNIGTPLILVVFIIIALVTFGMLSIINTNKDYSYTEKIATRTADYYDTNNAAEELLGTIDEILYSAYSTDQNQYFTDVASSLTPLSNVTYDFDTDIPTIQYTLPINDTQALFIKLLINYPINPDQSFYQITAWQEISTINWKADTDIQLMQYQ